MWLGAAGIRPQFLAAPEVRSGTGGVSNLPKGQLNQSPTTQG